MHLNLKGEEWRRVYELVLGTFDALGLTLLVQRVAPQIEPMIAWRQPLAEVVYHLIKLLEQHGVTSQFLLAAAADREHRPDWTAMVVRLHAAHPGRVDSRPFGQLLERIMGPVAAFLPLDRFVHALLGAGRWVCAVETPDDHCGTGFLIAPDLVLTNYHVAGRLVERTIATQSVACVFDYREGIDGRLREPVRVGLDPRWEIPFRPTSRADEFLDGSLPAPEELDYVVLRLDRAIGEEAAGERMRGWFDVTGNLTPPAAGSMCVIVQHPGRLYRLPGEPLQDPLRVAIALPGFVGLNANETRLEYRADTLPGSSGAPVLDALARPVALHVGTGEHNRGVPLVRIVEDLAAKHPGVRARLVASP